MLAVLIGLMMGVPIDSRVLTVDLTTIDPIEIKKELWIDKLQECESGGNENAAVIDTNGYWSRGLFQFQLSTWLAYGKEFGATRENIFDGGLQRKVVREMLDDGGWRHWTNCGNAVSRSIGAYPSNE